MPVCIYVDFAIRGKNVLDLVSTNVAGAYSAEPRPHLRYSDHISIMPVLAYRRRALKTGSEACEIVLSSLTGACLGRLHLMKTASTSVTGFTTKCKDDITITIEHHHREEKDEEEAVDDYRVR